MMRRTFSAWPLRGGTQLKHSPENPGRFTLGQIGAITDPIADLVAVPTDLLNTTRDWHSDFTGPAGSLVTALTELSDGTSLSESWRDVLQDANTVTETDIRNVYPGSADAAVAVFQRRRDYADRSVVLAHARADAAASLAATAVEVQDKIDTVAGQNNVSETALHWLRLFWDKRSLPEIYLKDSSLQHWHRWKLWKHPQQRPQPTTQKWRGERPPRGDWPIVPLLKRSGPGNRRP